MFLHINFSFKSILIALGLVTCLNFLAVETIFASSAKCIDLLAENLELKLSDNIVTINAPKEFRLPVSSSGKVILYRGDLRGLEFTGMQSNAIAEGLTKVLTEAADIIESGDIKQINRLIGKHTSDSSGSPFLSTSLSPLLAQAFARENKYKTVLKRKETTIYKIEIDPSRIIADTYNIGLSGNGGEVLIIGEIHSSEISAVKIDNSLLESELLYELSSGSMGEPLFFSDHPSFKSEPIYEVQNADNWMHIHR